MDTGQHGLTGRVAAYLVGVVSKGDPGIATKVYWNIMSAQDHLLNLLFVTAIIVSDKKDLARVRHH